MIRAIIISFLTALSIVGCSNFQSTDAIDKKLTPVVVQNVFQCSGGIVEENILSSKYSSLKKENISEREIRLALEKTLRGAGMSDAAFIKYGECIKKLNEIQQKHNSRLDMALYRINEDRKSEVIDVLEILSDDGEAFSNKKIEDISRWISGYIPKDKKIPIDVNIPKNIKAGMSVKKFFSNLDGLHPTYYIWKVQQFKQRGALEEDGIIRDAQSIIYPFTIEVNIPGYQDIFFHMKNKDEGYIGKELANKQALRVAIEKISGKEHGISERIAKALKSKRDEILVFDPEQIKIIRDEIARHEREISENPVAQIGERKTLSDYILTGSVTTQLDRPAE